MPRRRSVIATVSNVLQESNGVRLLFDPPAVEATNGVFARLEESSLHPAIIQGIKHKYADGLYGHQHLAIENALAGRHTVTATRTSSGKSLTFALPALHSLCMDQNSTALFLYPQKALANDQIWNLKKLVESMNPTAELLRSNENLVERYDGSTCVEKRKRIRDSVHFLATNPDMLHIAILQHHKSLWGRFFANLKLVAIDECHDYRGAFGSHVAMVLRRLREVCRFHGAEPVFTASSATIAHPKEHLQQLTGLPFEMIGPEMDQSKQGRRKIWMVDSDSHHYELGRHLAVQLVQAGLRVLVFCPSRMGAEKMLEHMRTTDGVPDQQVAVYRAGLASAQRDKIEYGLKTGSVRLVFSTSALELGIDIGQLDVVICVGLPATMMSLWQRAGRVARGGREGAIVLIPGSSPMQSHHAGRPQELLDRENEPIAINIENEKIVCQHYACAIKEMGGVESALDVRTLGPGAVHVQERRNRGEFSCGDEFLANDPHGMVNLRNTGERNYRLVCNGATIGDIGTFHLLREAPRNAIYRHGGQTYRVQSIVKEDRVVRLQIEHTRNETVAFVRKTLVLGNMRKRTNYPDLQIAVGRIDVTEYLETLTEKDPYGNIRKTWTRPGGMPTHRLRTEGALVILKATITRALERQLGASVNFAIESAERLLASLFPTISGPCDPQDYSSGVLTTGEGDLAIVLYDMTPGGIGLTEVVYQRLRELVENAIDRVVDCSCEGDKGCICCVADPYQESTASKTAALALLRAMKSGLETGECSTWIADGDDSFLAMELAPVQCPDCHATVAHSSRFCSNCGCRLEVANV